MTYETVGSGCDCDLALERGGECLPEPVKTGEVTHWLESCRSPRLCLAGLATLAGEMMKGTLSLFLRPLCLAGA